MAKTTTKKRPAGHKASPKSKADNSALIRAINPPDEVLAYDPAVMQALHDRFENEKERIRSAREMFQRQLYHEIFSWWVPEIEDAMRHPLCKGWEDQLQAIYAKADEEWVKLSGLPPVVRWNRRDWRRAAKLAEYTGDDPETIIDGLIVRFTTKPAPGSVEWSTPVGKIKLRSMLTISRNTLNSRLIEGSIPVTGKIRYQAPKGARKIQVAVDDLPTDLQNRFRRSAKS